jgi:hypothetical protein
MNVPACASPISVATLLEYWLGELDEAREGQLDEHLLGCGHCSANLQSLVDIAGGVRAAVRAGAVRTVITDEFVQRLVARGLRLREYRVPHNGSVYCTVAPHDDLLISRLDAPLAGVERLDVELTGGEAHHVERLRDIPFDAAAGEVVIAQQMDRIRALPASTARVRLLAVEAGGERVVGEYLFNHTPWEAGDRG